MENPVITFIAVAIFAFVAFKIFRKRTKAKRTELIDSYVFPRSISEKIIEKYPHLTEQDADMVLHGLREYFHICNLAGRKMVSMPSQVVDVAWHEFILFTKHYEHFCHKALGRFLHHTPAEAMSSPTMAQKGIKTAWKTSCYRAGIPHTSPHSLPILFAIDTKLNIEDGFKYSLDCKRQGGGDYCASHIGCGSGCGGGCGGDSSGCGGGD